MLYQPPRITIFATAMTSGILLALAMQILSGRFGIAVGSGWQNLFPTDAHAMRSALGWWLVVATGFLGSFLVGLLAQDLSGRRRPRRKLQGLIAVVFFLTLAGVPFVAAPALASSLPIAFGANVAVFVAGTITAFCGSWFALHR
jgi:hypothetical protein